MLASIWKGIPEHQGVSYLSYVCKRVGFKGSTGIWPKTIYLFQQWEGFVNQWCSLNLIFFFPLWEGFSRSKISHGWFGAGCHRTPYWIQESWRHWSGWLVWAVRFLSCYHCILALSVWTVVLLHIYMQKWNLPWDMKLWCCNGLFWGSGLVYVYHQWRAVNAWALYV